MIEEKLPERIAWEWAKQVSKKDSVVDETNKFPGLLEFLLEQRRIIEYSHADLRNSKHTKAYTHHVEEVDEVEDENCNLSFGGTSGDSQTSGKRCCFHKSDNHTTWGCRAYLALSAEDRVKCLKENRGCWSCLRIGHRSADCRFRKQCGKDGCDKWHHETLHEADASGVVFHSSTVKEEHSNNACLLQLMKVECDTKSESAVNVLWDGGSTVSLITFSKAKELGLKGEKVKLSIVKVGGNREEISSYLYELPLRNQNGERVVLQVYGIDKVSTNLRPIDLSAVVQLFEGVTEEELKRPEGEVDVLVGFEYAGYHPVRQQSVNNLLILRNQFGMCMGGAHKLLKERTRKIVQTVIIHHLQRATVEDFYGVEQLGISCTPRCGGCRCGNCHLGGKDYTLKEERELRLIQEGLTNCDGYWTAQYPWIRDPKELPDNKIAALKMHTSQHVLAKK